MFVRSLTLGVAAAALMVSGASAADLFIPTTPAPIYEPAGFDWEGLYAGVRAGGTFTDVTTYGVIGGAVGVNFIPVDPLLLGVEVTGDYVWGNGVSFGEFFANLRAGAVVTDSALIYALAGVGMGVGDFVGNDSVGMYQMGAGVEFAVTDSVTVRGEVVGIGYFDDARRNNFFDEAKATVGVFYHF